LREFIPDDLNPLKPMFNTNTFILSSHCLVLERKGLGLRILKRDLVSILGEPAAPLDEGSSNLIDMKNYLNNKKKIIIII
jgi:hypothetical protein